MSGLCALVQGTTCITVQGISGSWPECNRKDFKSVFFVVVVVIPVPSVSWIFQLLFIFSSTENAPFVHWSLNPPLVILEVPVSR